MKEGGYMRKRLLFWLACFAWMGCASEEEAVQGDDEGDILAQSDALTTTRTVSGTLPWQDTGLNVKPGDRVDLSCTSGLIAPWPGHSGFNCSGDPNTYWGESLADFCPFMSLV